MFNKLCFVSIVLIFAFSALNAADENYALIEIVWLSLLAITAPAMATGFALCAQKRAKRPVALRIGVFIILAIGILAYGYYATNGKTDPDTAAHMHVVAFPLIYSLLSLIVMVILGAVGLTGDRSSNKDLKRNS